jgi:hypothetical protein
MEGFCIYRGVRHFAKKFAEFPGEVPDTTPTLQGT